MLGFWVQGWRDRSRTRLSNIATAGLKAEILEHLAGVMNTVRIENTSNTQC